MIPSIRRKLRIGYTFCLDDQVVPLTPLLDEVCFEVPPKDIPDRFWKPGALGFARDNSSPVFAVGGDATVSLRWVYSEWKHNDLADVARKQLIATVTYDGLYW